MIAAKIIILWSGDDGEIYRSPVFYSNLEAREWVDRRWQGQVDYGCLPSDVVKVLCESTRTDVELTIAGGAQ